MGFTKTFRRLKNQRERANSRKRPKKINLKGVHEACNQSARLRDEEIKHMPPEKWAHKVVKIIAWEVAQKREENDGRLLNRK